MTKLKEKRLMTFKNMKIRKKEETTKKIELI